MRHIVNMHRSVFVLPFMELTFGIPAYEQPDGMSLCIRSFQFGFRGCKTLERDALILFQMRGTDPDLRWFTKMRKIQQCHGAGNVHKEQQG